MALFSAVALLITVIGCSDTSTNPDVGASDASDGGTSGPDSSSPDGAVIPPADGGAVDGGPSGGDWPVPVPGSAGTGPACPDPAQGPMGADWPEVFVGVEGCDDDAAGDRDAPFCTFERAFEVADAAPYIVTVLDGTYRQRDHEVSRRGTAEEYFVIRADEGATPVILGSEALLGANFETVDGGLLRVDVSALPSDPTGFWTAAGTRMIHVMEDRDGRRSHANTADVVDPGTWTKADAAGAGCGGDNAGCFIYLRPTAGLDVAATEFEASQGSFITSIGGHYQVVDGISTRFTQDTAIFFESARHILIQNGDFAHNANSDDNSYNLRLWGADGALVRRNRVSDSRYWGGRVNSHGITFMVAGDEDDIWVCENEVFDMIGMGVSTKGGSSNVHVVGNYLHDIGTGVHTSNSRCDWEGCDVHLYPGGSYTVRENLFERCGTGVSISATDARPESVGPSRVFNNLFVDGGEGVETARASVQPTLRNNVFMGSGTGLYFSAGTPTTWPDYYIAEGFDSDFNLFDVETSVYVYADWSGTERAMSLTDYQSDYGGEGNSTE
ncbi:MAG: right-handed parallel beta-helix repeat-containing protein, partial [Deltaproteobacteria bacterium]|nr:right-handed parallel beta-helix repeat-containing protein [Deltaproteobacteria bacterium]